MEQIVSSYGNILNILGKARKTDNVCRMNKYCIDVPVGEDMLIFNLLTREMVLLSKSEYEVVYESEYMKEHWFVIPEELNEKEFADLVRWVYQNMDKTKKSINAYTILTTTDCNARCYYCYEKGCSKISMSEQTALKTVDYIKNHYNGKMVTLNWFGGEPLMNIAVIDKICEELKKENINYVSNMTSNGYLFNEEVIQKAKNLWNLNRVQITLDGTEEMYNHTKAYIYTEGSAYQVVLKNIFNLLATNISVVVRMNICPDNAENLMDLADELALRFSDEENLSAYAHILFEYENSNYKELYSAFNRLEEKMLERGLSKANTNRVRKDIHIHHCMADSGSSVVIVPDGHIGLCEHFSESEFIGHIDSETRDEKMIESWRERKEEIPECTDCFYYPECIKLKKCPNVTACNEYERKLILKRTKRTMLNEWLAWKKMEG